MAKGLLAWFAGRKPAQPQAAYLRPDSSGVINYPRVSLRDPDEDVSESWERAAGLAVHAMHNSGWIAGGVEQATASIVGTGLRLNCKPDAEALGWTPEQASEFARNVERRWEAWANDPAECDVTGRMTVGQMTAAAMRTWFGCGEAVALLRQVNRHFTTSRVKVHMIPPQRLVQDTNEFIRLHNGVLVDSNGFPIAYRFKLRIDGADHDVDVRARDRRGRPQVIHVFDGMAGQVRGITPLAPALKIVRQYDQLADATLTTTMLQTIFAATLESSGLSNEAFEGLMTETDGKTSGFEQYMEMQAKWADSIKVDLGQSGRINHLLPGQKLTFHSSQHPHDNYLPFSRGLLREVARCLGITYEDLTLDNEGATYSSIQMGTSVIWRIAEYRRRVIAIPFVRPVYEAWLDEEIMSGRTQFPGGYRAFLDNRKAVMRSEWHGPPKPVADEAKDARAAAERLESGTTSLAYECARLGLEVDSVLEARARERETALRLGLPDPYAPKQASAPLAEPDDVPAKPPKEARND